MDAKPTIVKVLKPFGMYWPGMIAGFEPDQADRLIAQRIAVRVTLDESGNTAIVHDEPVAAPHAAAPPLAPGASEPSKIDIPEDWETQHHLVQIRIAKLISGAEKMTAAEAKQVITTETARRAAVAQPEN